MKTKNFFFLTTVLLIAISCGKNNTPSTPVSSSITQDPDTKPVSPVVPIDPISPIDQNAEIEGIYFRSMFKTPFTSYKGNLENWFHAVKITPTKFYSCHIDIKYNIMATNTVTIIGSPSSNSYVYQDHTINFPNNHLAPFTFNRTNKIIYEPDEKESENPDIINIDLYPISKADLTMINAAGCNF